MKKKICYRCKVSKNLNNFSKNKSRKDRHSSQCRECHSILRREHYNKNTKKIKAQVKQQKKLYKKWFRELKNNPCVDCKVQYPYYVMQFDHINSENKKDNIGTMFIRYSGKQKILDEIAKCELVCANCHAERTYQRMRVRC